MNPYRRDDQEAQFEETLRPKSFDEFVGQSKTVENLKIAIKAARKRNEPIDHILFSGLPGLGKTTLARLISYEMKVDFKQTSGPVLKRPGDLAGILTGLKRGDILFIDEIHRIAKDVEEYLYPAMEDFFINITLDSGPHAKMINLTLKRFTLIGATTREGLLSDAFRARFGILEKLNFYPVSDLKKIITRSAKILDVKIVPEAAELIASRCRGTPRIANRFLRRIRDLAQLKSNNIISKDIAEEGLNMLGIDKKGLDETDRKILNTLIQYEGGPIGLKTIGVAIGEEDDTIEEVYEPYLIQQGFLQKTSRGRKVTKKAFEHMKTEFPQQSTLFRE
jgi:Holliday junction DNA helicase RuvB